MKGLFSILCTARRPSKGLHFFTTFRSQSIYLGLYRFYNDSFRNFAFEDSLFRSCNFQNDYFGFGSHFEENFTARKLKGKQLEGLLKFYGLPYSGTKEKKLSAVKEVMSKKTVKVLFEKSLYECFEERKVEHLQESTKIFEIQTKKNLT